MAQTFFATINPGLEEALLEEVRELGGKRPKVIRGGVEFEASNVKFYQAAHQFRCANRLWMRVDEFRSRDTPELYNKTKRFDWARLIPRDAPIEVRATSHRSGLHHTGQIEETVADGINDSLDRKPATEGVPIVVLARIVENRCQLSLDASGDLHYRRGWKEAAVAAPIRESVAAALLRLARWSPGTTVVDPFCGSGTIVIEAAQRSAEIAAGAERAFAFHRWANFQPDVWAETISKPRAELDTIVSYGSDIDEKAIEAARHNAERANVADLSAFAVADVAELTAPSVERGFIVTNPPWGLRVEDPGLAAIDKLIEVHRERFAGWALAFVAPADWSGPAESVAEFQLGGIAVRLWTIDI